MRKKNALEEHIRELLKKRGFRKDYLARQMGYQTYQGLSYRLGQAEGITVLDLMRLSRILDCPAEQLFEVLTRQHTASVT